MSPRADPNRSLICEDEALDRSTWKVQRVSWAVATLFLLAAIGGVFGSGLFSRSSAASPDGTVRLSFERFTRADSLSSLKVERLVPRSELRDAPLTLYVRGDGLTETLQVEQLVPVPLRSRVSDNFIELVFASGTEPTLETPVLVRLKLQSPELLTLLLSTSPEFPASSTARVRLTVFP